MSVKNFGFKCKQLDIAQKNKKKPCLFFFFFGHYVFNKFSTLSFQEKELRIEKVSKNYFSSNVLILVEGKPYEVRLFMYMCLTYSLVLEYTGCSLGVTEVDEWLKDDKFNYYIAEEKRILFSRQRKTRENN